ncbi:MAG: sensor histidine kinase [Clostridium sp.]|uniref:sensor histidine kinase n=1 Tax=Clostridium sp. TaxID=1506 RepID=UPI003F2D8338
MGFEVEIKDNIYINRYKYRKIVGILAAIYILTIILTGFCGVFFNYLLKSFYLISSFCIVLLTYSTANVTEGRIFKKISTIFIVVIVMNLNSMVRINSKSDVLKWDDYDIMHPYTINILFMLSMGFTFKYINKEKARVAKDILGILAIIWMLVIIENNDFKFITFIIANIIAFLAILKNYNRIKRYKIIEKDKINYFYIYFLIMAFYSVSLFLSIIFSRFIHLRAVSNFLFYIGYSTMLLCVIEKMLHTPYKILFKDLYDSSEKLNLTNNIIIIKNNELEESHKAIRKNELMFKEFFKSIPVPIIILSDATFRIIYSNKAFLKLIKVEKIKKIINKKISSFINLEEEITLKGRLDINKIYCGTIEDDKDKKYLNLDIVDYNKENGEIILRITDITTMMDMNSIKESIEEKVFQERIRSDFLSNISHDIKTPINVIYSALQLEHIFTKNDDIESLIKYNSISKKNCLALMKLTNNLIDSSRIQQDYLYPTLEKVNIVTFIEEIIESLVYYAKEKDISLIFDTNNEDILLDIDESFMQRILLNLISNSIKFTSKNGMILVNVFENEKDIKIIIEDNGIGMDKHFVNKIFVKYAMGQNNNEISEKGSGIGLFVVKKLVELQNGVINIDSEEGKGTKITITFKKGSV